MKALEFPPGDLTVLCLGAHPDDIEIGCGGTLLTLARRGNVHAHHLTLTGTAQRAIEARNAASAFSPGSEFDCAELPDARLPEVWHEVKTALHRWQTEVPAPDIIFAPRADDAHQDHALLGSLVSTVWRDSLILHYEIPKWDGDLSRPNSYVEIDPVLARRKVELLNEHFPSQLAHEWWDDELFLALLRVRGMETRTRYAEAFTVSKALISFGF